jgi:sulfonate transport system permease protein
MPRPASSSATSPRGAGRDRASLAAQRAGGHRARAAGLLPAAGGDRADPARLLRPRPGPQIALAALAVYYTTLIPLLVGLRAAPDSWFDLVRSYGRGRMAALVHVRAMAALPYLFAGLQIAAPAAFLGAMVGEFTGAERGMGVLTIRAIRALDVEMTWGLATVATAVAILAYLAIGALARRVLLEAPPVILAARRPRRRAAFRRVDRHRAGDPIWRWGWAGAIWAFGLNPFFAKGPGDVFDALVLAPDAARPAPPSARRWPKRGVPAARLLAGLAAGAALAILLVLCRPSRARPCRWPSRCARCPS